MQVAQCGFALMQESARICCHSKNALLVLLLEPGRATVDISAPRGELVRHQQGWGSKYLLFLMALAPRMLISA
jgi:hypothetical protein